MKKLMILMIIFSLFIVIKLTGYNEDQSVRYSDRYSVHTAGQCVGIDPPNNIWLNVNPFINDLELGLGASEELAGYIDYADCAHFVS